MAVVPVSAGGTPITDKLAQSPHPNTMASRPNIAPTMGPPPRPAHCTARTKGGTACQNKTAADSLFCGSHERQFNDPG